VESRLITLTGQEPLTPLAGQGSPTPLAGNGVWLPQAMKNPLSPVIASEAISWPIWGLLRRLRRLAM
jgi:hypothetical protein